MLEVPNLGDDKYTVHGPIVHPLTGKPVTVKASKEFYKNERGESEGAGIVFEQPTNFPASDAQIVATRTCCFCKHYRSYYESLDPVLPEGVVFEDSDRSPRVDDRHFDYCLVGKIKLYPGNNAICDRFEVCDKSNTREHENPTRGEKYQDEAEEYSDLIYGPHIYEEHDCHDMAMEILKSGNVVEYFLKSYHKIHVGDDDHATFLLLSQACQCTTSTKGLQPGTNGESGSGKTDSCYAMSHLLPREYTICSSVTDQVLFYMSLRPGTTIFLDDVQNMSDALQAAIKQSTSAYQQGFMRKSLSKDRKVLELCIPPRTSWWLTSVDNAFEDQLVNRQINLTVDDSKEHKIDIVKYKLRQAARGQLPFPEDQEVWTCREIIRILKSNDPVRVVIPYAERIHWRDLNNIRNLEFFLDTIISFAVLYQYQRQRDETGAVIATEEDFKMAARLWQSISKTQVNKLTNPEMKVIQALKEFRGGEVTISELQEKTNMSRGRLSQILNGENGKGGLLSKVPSLQREEISEQTEKGKSVRKLVYKLPHDYDIFGNYEAIVTLEPEPVTYEASSEVLLHAQKQTPMPIIVSKTTTEKKSLAEKIIDLRAAVTTINKRGFTNAPYSEIIRELIELGYDEATAKSIIRAGLEFGIIFEFVPEHYRIVQR